MNYQDGKASHVERVHIHTTGPTKSEDYSYVAAEIEKRFVSGKRSLIIRKEALRWQRNYLLSYQDRVVLGIISLVAVYDLYSPHVMLSSDRDHRSRNDYHSVRTTGKNDPSSLKNLSSSISSKKCKASSMTMTRLS